VGDYGTVAGEAAMMSEIYKRGPISCSLDAGPIESYTGGIFYDNSTQCKCPRPNPNPTLTPRPRTPQKRTLTVIQRHPRPLTLTDTGSIDHTISIAGWGEGYSEMAGKVIPYWVLRNSWGTPWGEGGWMRISRGINTLGLESGCAWAVPIVPA
jgi:cathepsin X